MADRNLTPQQRAAVEDRGGNLLVSAAAGSGKTKVLVERLFGYIEEERCHVDDFLIITYTRAAAAELRGRIAQELSARLARNPGDRHLQQQLYRVYRADIKTVDSFCAALLRENVHLLDLGEETLTADFRVLEENEAELLRRRALRDTLEAYYLEVERGEADGSLADTFGVGRDDRGLEDLILTLHEKLQSHAYPERWALEARAMWENLPASFDQTPYAGILLEDFRRKALHWALTLERALDEMALDAAVEKAYGPTFQTAAEDLRALAERSRTGWDAMYAGALAFRRLGAVRGSESGPMKERMKTLWELCKKEMKSACAVFSVSGEEAMEDLAAVSPSMAELLRQAIRFGERYDREKRRRNTADFSDQEHLAIRLLLDGDGRPTALCRRVAGRYREIMVDEYQDTNEVQNCIFEALAAERRNLFCVGDVKQSIYRFRLADPTIFLRKYRAFAPWEAAEEGEDRKILLSRNFRSRREVLDAVYFVFSQIMSPEIGEMTYGAEEQLYFGAEYFVPREDCQTEFHLLDMQQPEEDDPAAARRPLAEARFVAGRIAAMLAEGFPVQGEDGALRPCVPGDFAVLMRSPGPRLRWYLQALGERGIPCAAVESEDFFSAMEVAVAVNLLEVIDNPRQDVPLISVLSSPPFGFTADRLARIRGKTPAGDFWEALEADGEEDTARFLENLSALREEAKELSVYQLLTRLYRRLDLLTVFGAMDGGAERQRNLMALGDCARSFEEAGYRGLFAFVSHLREMLERGEAPETAASAGGEGVQIMSIHKSKGLEFPIVFLADLSKDFSRQDFQQPVLVHPQQGLGPMRVDLGRKIRYPTLARTAVEQLLRRESRSEEMRVLYVAMTRAKEKLILVASMKHAATRLGRLAAVADCPTPPNAVESAGSMTQWILLPLLCRPEAGALRALAGSDPAAFAPPGDSPWLVQVHDGRDYLRRPGVRLEGGEAAPRLDPDFDGALLTFRYPYAAAPALPTKVTATQLKGREKDAEIAEGTAPVPRQRPLCRPAFLAGETLATAADRGTATHAAMQYLDLDAADGEAELERLEREGRITADQRRLADRAGIQRFLNSPLAEEMRRAQGLRREYRFSLLVPAEDYLGPEAAREEVLLQGVVDCFFETPEGLVVVDFKTDRVTEATVRQRGEEYRAQVEAYSAALERIFQKPVCRRLLYFLHIGAQVEL